MRTVDGSQLRWGACRTPHPPTRGGIPRSAVFHHCSKDKLCVMKNSIGMRASASGRSLSLAQKPHWGFCPRSLIGNRRTAVRLCLRARFACGACRPPAPARLLACGSFRHLRARARQALRALALRSLSRPLRRLRLRFGSVASGLWLGSNRLRHSPRSALACARPRGSPLGKPFPALRSTAGAVAPCSLRSSGRSLKAPRPAVLNRAFRAGIALLWFPSPPPARLEAGAEAQGLNIALNRKVARGADNSAEELSQKASARHSE